MNDLATPHDIEIVAPGSSTNPALVYLAALTASGRRSQTHALKEIAGMLGGDLLAIPWERLRYEHLAAIRAELMGRYKPATVNRMLCAARGVLKAAWRLDLITSDDYVKAAAIESVKGATIPAGRDLSSGELAGLMGVCADDSTPAGVRDGSMIALLYACGLRRDELVSLTLADYDQDTGKLVVMGKRSKQRLVWVTNGGFDALSDWLAIRGDAPGALFKAINKSGKIAPIKMTSQAVYYILQRRGSDAGVKAFSPHDMRRTFAGDMLDAGVDIATVAKMMGHSSVNVTARYDRRPEEVKRKAAGMLFIPYKRRVA